jgi:predicted transposase YbfD/YdcC
MRPHHLPEQVRQNWLQLTWLVSVEKQVYHKASGQLLEESKSYKACDLALSAKSFALGIRGHWATENPSHRVRDVILGQDRNKIKDDQGALHMALFNTLAVNYLRQQVCDSVKYGRIIFGQSIKERFPLMRT